MNVPSSTPSVSSENSPKNWLALTSQVEVFGPFTLEELRAHVGAGRIPTTANFFQKQASLDVDRERAEREAEVAKREAESAVREAEYSERMAKAAKREAESASREAEFAERMAKREAEFTQRMLETTVREAELVKRVAELEEGAKREAALEAQVAELSKCVGEAEAREAEGAAREVGLRGELEAKEKALEARGKEMEGMRDHFAVREAEWKGEVEKARGRIVALEGVAREVYAAQAEVMSRLEAMLGGGKSEPEGGAAGEMPLEGAGVSEAEIVEASGGAESEATAEEKEARVASVEAQAQKELEQLSRMGGVVPEWLRRGKRERGSRLTR